MRWHDKLLVLFVFAFVLAVSPVVFADSLIVTGAGSSTVNQTYTSDGSGHWISADTKYWIMNDVPNSSCRLGYNGSGSGASPQYYWNTHTCTTASGAVGTWGTADGMTAPPPSVALGSSGGGTVPIGGATSTEAQAQQNLFNGFLVFFMSFFGVVWLFRKR